MTVFNNGQLIGDLDLQKSQSVVYFEGVPRETDKEREFADFDIFDDPETPYSTFNFQYSNQAFTQLHDLMEFNTLNNIEVSYMFPILTNQIDNITLFSPLVKK